MSYQLELKVLNSIFVKGMKRNELEKLLAVESELFQDYETRRIFEKAKLRYAEKKELDLDLLEGHDEAVLQDLLHTSSGLTAEGYINELKDEKLKADLLKLTEQLGSKTKEEILTQIDGITRKASADTAKRTMFSLKDLNRMHLNNMDNPVTNSMKTGWEEFDRMCKFKKGDLNVIAARPAIGKSAFSLALALQFARKGHKGVFFSMEMPEMDIAHRMIASISGIPLDYLRETERFMELQEGPLHAHAEALSLLDRLGDNLKVVSGTASIADIRTFCNIAKESGLDYIMVDYLGLIRHKARDLYTKATEISLALKAIAMELDITVIALSQLSRENEKRADKIPQLSDLRDSGQIEQDASAVMFLHRPYYYNKDIPEPNKMLMNVIVAKNRNGSTGELCFKYHLPSQAIKAAKREDFIWD